MSAHKNWQSVLDQLKKEDPNTDNFYMIICRSGKDQLSRSHFMTHAQAVANATAEIEKAKK